MCVCLCVCVYVYRRHSQKCSTDVSVISRTTAGTNEERRESRARDGDYRLLFIQRTEQFRKRIHVRDAIGKTRVRREKADYIFPTRYSSNRFLSLSLSLSPPFSPLPSLLSFFRSSPATFILYSFLRFTDRDPHCDSRVANRSAFRRSVEGRTPSCHRFFSPFQVV